MSSIPTWYYQLDGVLHGPVTDQALKHLASTGVIGEGTLVRRGESPWKPAGLVKELVIDDGPMEPEMVIPAPMARPIRSLPPTAIASTAARKRKPLWPWVAGGTGLVLLICLGLLLAFMPRESGFSKGQRVFLFAKELGVIPLARDEASFGELHAFIEQRNRDALGQLADLHKVIVKDQYDRATFIRSGRDYYVVRPTEGIGSGDDWLVRQDYVHAEPE